MTEVINQHLKKKFLRDLNTWKNFQSTNDLHEELASLTSYLEITKDDIKQVKEYPQFVNMIARDRVFKLAKREALKEHLEQKWSERISNRINYIKSKEIQLHIAQNNGEQIGIIDEDIQSSR
jgi:Txe/YoeB family toxin of Txe-Axe toxin-antitoxin module